MPQDEIDDKQVDGALKERFKQLPKVVQDSINSAEIQGHLRTLADTHKLHLDQWQTLENDVMLTLLGFQKPEDLEQNLKKDLDIDAETATALAGDISKIVFDPIRQELERELDHPEAQAKEVSGVENVGARELAAANAADAPPVAAQPVAPAPIAGIPEPPETKAVRAPISEVYKAGEASSARKDVHNDPYREPPA
jgi:hypothetical protein